MQLEIARIQQGIEQVEPATLAGGEAREAPQSARRLPRPQVEQEWLDELLGQQREICALRESIEGGSLERATRKGMGELADLANEDEEDDEELDEAEGSDDSEALIATHRDEYDHAIPAQIRADRDADGNPDDAHANEGNGDMLPRLLAQRDELNELLDTKARLEAQLSAVQHGVGMAQASAAQPPQAPQPAAPQPAALQPAAPQPAAPQPAAPQPAASQLAASNALRVAEEREAAAEAAPEAAAAEAALMPFELHGADAEQLVAILERRREAQAAVDEKKAALTLSHSSHLCPCVTSQFEPLCMTASPHAP